MALKLLATDFFNNCFKIFELISAFVKIKDNIVARLGAIIPEPFAIPAILITLFPTLNSSYANFGLVSVVIIAEAIFTQINLFASSLSLATNVANELLIFSTGNSSPITPVEAKMISFIFTVSLIPDSFLDSFKVSSLDKPFAISSRLSKPCLPVKVFAFFVFTNSALIDFLLDF